MSLELVITSLVESSSLIGVLSTLGSVAAATCVFVKSAAESAKRIAELKKDKAENDLRIAESELRLLQLKNEVATLELENAVSLLNKRQGSLVFPGIHKKEFFDRVKVELQKQESSLKFEEASLECEDKEDVCVKLLSDFYEKALAVKSKSDRIKLNEHFLSSFKDNKIDIDSELLTLYVEGIDNIHTVTSEIENLDREKVFKAAVRPLHHAFLTMARTKCEMPTVTIKKIDGLD